MALPTFDDHEKGQGCHILKEQHARCGTAMHFGQLTLCLKLFERDAA